MNSANQERRADMFPSPDGSVDVHSGPKAPADWETERTEEPTEER